MWNYPEARHCSIPPKKKKKKTKKTILKSQTFQNAGLYNTRDPTRKKYTQNLQLGKLQLASGQQQKIILWLRQELQSQKKA